MLIWTVIEVNVVMIAVCIPSLQPFSRKLAESIHCARQQAEIKTHVFLSSSKRRDMRNKRSLRLLQSIERADENELGTIQVPTRTLEDAADVLHPPDLIWKQDVWVGRPRGMQRLAR